MPQLYSTASPECFVDRMDGMRNLIHLWAQVWGSRYRVGIGWGKLTFSFMWHRGNICYLSYYMVDRCCMSGESNLVGGNCQSDQKKSKLVKIYCLLFLSLQYIFCKASIQLLIKWTSPGKKKYDLQHGSAKQCCVHSLREMSKGTQLRQPELKNDSGKRVSGKGEAGVSK